VRPREGLTVLGARSLIGVGLPAVFAVGSAFFGDAGRSGAFFAAFFRIVLAFLTVLLRIALLAGLFLRFAWAFANRGRRETPLPPLSAIRPPGYGSGPRSEM
jgi:hypothetical protein